MGQSEQSPKIYKVTVADFKAIFDIGFRQYMKDPEVNPLLKLRNDSKIIRKQIGDEINKQAMYEKSFDALVERQQMFMKFKGILPRNNTKSIGVNVNIPSNENHSNTQTKEESLLPSLPKKARYLASSADDKSNITEQKPKSIDVVDLTMDDDKAVLKSSRPTNVASNQKQIMPRPPTPSIPAACRPQSPSVPAVSRSQTPSVSPAPVSSIQPVFQLSSQMAPTVVQFPTNNAFSTLGPSVPAGGSTQYPRFTYVMPANPSVNMRPILVASHNRSVSPSPQFSVNGVQPLERPAGQYSTPREQNRSILIQSPLPAALTTHPAPLPELPVPPASSIIGGNPPPKPSLKISKPATGIVLSWNLRKENIHSAISLFQLYGYEENAAVESLVWRKIGDIKALPLPMACTLTHFVDGRRYHFAIRAVDVQSRIGPFSDIASITLLPRYSGIGKSL